MRRLFLDDDLRDWSLAQKWGELAVRIDPEDLTHRLVVARACRHLGDRQRALLELETCRTIIQNGHISPVEQEVVVRLVETEMRLLSSE